MFGTNASPRLPRALGPCPGEANSANTSAIKSHSRFGLRDIKIAPVSGAAAIVKRDLFRWVNSASHPVCPPCNFHKGSTGPGRALRRDRGLSAESPWAFSRFQCGSHAPRNRQGSGRPKQRAALTVERPCALVSLPVAGSTHSTSAPISASIRPANTPRARRSDQAPAARPMHRQSCYHRSSVVSTAVAAAENMPPTPCTRDSFAPLTCAGEMPRICRTPSCRANMPYMPECM